MISTYYKNLIYNVAWKTTAAASIPSTLWLGLSKTAPAVDGSNISEPDVSTGYTRVSLAGKLGAAENGIVTNSSDISTAESPAAQGTVTHFVIYDAQSGGNFLASGALTNSRTIEVQTSLVFPAGSLTITLEDKE